MNSSKTVLDASLLEAMYKTQYRTEHYNQVQHVSSLSCRGVVLLSGLNFRMSLDPP